MKYEIYLNKAKNTLEKYSSNFELELLGQKLEYPIIKIKSKKINKKIDLVVVSGIHGEEAAGPLAIIKYLPEILAEVKKRNIKLIIYPMVNFYGFERNKRFNKEKISCNSFWIHEKGKMAKESALVKKDILKYKAKYSISMHENGEMKKRYSFFYAFGDIKAAQNLVKAASSKMPVLKKGFSGKDGENKIINGIVYNWHDGTFEDFMFHQGTKASICSETALKSDLKLRMSTDYIFIKEMIKIASS